MWFRAVGTHFIRIRSLQGPVHGVLRLLVCALDLDRVLGLRFSILPLEPNIEIIFLISSWAVYIINKTKNKS